MIRQRSGRSEDGVGVIYDTFKIPTRLLIQRKVIYSVPQIHYTTHLVFKIPKKIKKGYYEMPRYTDDQKDSTVKLRLNSDMRKHLDNMAKIKNITVSEYLRKLISADMVAKKEV